MKFGLGLDAAVLLQEGVVGALDVQAGAVLVVQVVPQQLAFLPAHHVVVVGHAQRHEDAVELGQVADQGDVRHQLNRPACVHEGRLDHLGRRVQVTLRTQDRCRGPQHVISEGIGPGIQDRDRGLAQGLELAVGLQSDVGVPLILGQNADAMDAGADELRVHVQDAEVVRIARAAHEVRGDLLSVAGVTDARQVGRRDERRCVEGERIVQVRVGPAPEGVQCRGAVIIGKAQHVLVMIAVEQGHVRDASAGAGFAGGAVGAIGIGGAGAAGLDHEARLVVHAAILVLTRAIEDQGAGQAVGNTLCNVDVIDGQTHHVIGITLDPEADPQVGGSGQGTQVRRIEVVFQVVLEIHLPKNGGRVPVARVAGPNTHFEGNEIREVVVGHPPLHRGGAGRVVKARGRTRRVDGRGHSHGLVGSIEGERIEEDELVGRIRGSPFIVRTEVLKSAGCQAARCVIPAPVVVTVPLDSRTTGIVEEFPSDVLVFFDCRTGDHVVEALDVRDLFGAVEVGGVGAHAVGALVGGALVLVVAVEGRGTAVVDVEQVLADVRQAPVVGARVQVVAFGAGVARVSGHGTTIGSNRGLYAVVGLAGVDDAGIRSARGNAVESPETAVAPRVQGPDVLAGAGTEVAGVFRAGVLRAFAVDADRVLGAAGIGHDGRGALTGHAAELAVVILAGGRIVRRTVGVVVAAVRVELDLGAGTPVGQPIVVLTGRDGAGIAVLRRAGGGHAGTVRLATARGTAVLVVAQAVDAELVDAGFDRVVAGGVLVVVPLVVDGTGGPQVDTIEIEGRVAPVRPHHVRVQQVGVVQLLGLATDGACPGHGVHLDGDVIFQGERVAGIPQRKSRSVRPVVVAIPPRIAFNAQQEVPTGGNHARNRVGVGSTVLDGPVGDVHGSGSRVVQLDPLVVIISPCRGVDHHFVDDDPVCRILIRVAVRALHRR